MLRLGDDCQLPVWRLGLTKALGEPARYRSSGGPDAGSGHLECDFS